MTQATLFNPAGFRTHGHHVLAEMLRLIQDERPFRTESFQADIFAQRPTEVIEVKSVREELMSAKVNARQFHKHLAEYDELVYALWTSGGRLQLSPEELMERAEEYRGGGKVHPGVGGAGAYYQFDLSDDSFVDPFTKRRLRGPDCPDHALQLSLDGRAVKKPAVWSPGPNQLEVVKTLTFAGGLKAWEAGVLIHQLRGYCPDYPSRRGSGRVLQPGECCAAAVDDGAALLSILRDQGRVWKDEESGLWLLYPEKEWGA